MKYRNLHFVYKDDTAINTGILLHHNSPLLPVGLKKAGSLKPVVVLYTTRKQARIKRTNKDSDGKFVLQSLSMPREPFGLSS